MSKKRPLILITTGGTGGHVYPGLAVALELLSRDYRVAWLGTRAGLENKAVPAHGIDLHYLRVRGVRGKGFFAKFRAIFLVGFATMRALWLLLRLRPAGVVGLGGYVAGPTGVAAWLLRKPLLIHEQNAVAGTTNRMLAPLAKQIVAGFEGAFAGKRKFTVTGNPLRRELIEAGEGGTYTYNGERPLRLLILGGSLGAAPINETVPGAVRRLLRDDPERIEVWHQTGEIHFEEMRGRYAYLGETGVRVAPFIEDMAAAYQWADLVLCRAGALTVSEVSVMGRPSILVPLPQAIDDHQRANARALVDAGAGIVLTQGELDAYRLSVLLRDLASQPEKLRTMSVAAYRTSRPDATARVCDLCEEMIGGR